MLMCVDSTLVFLVVGNRFYDFPKRDFSKRILVCVDNPDPATKHPAALTKTLKKKCSFVFDPRAK